MWAIVMIWPASSFQSTLSVRRATICLDSGDVIVGISIHALREESDCSARLNI